MPLSYLMIYYSRPMHVTHCTDFRLGSSYLLLWWILV